MEQRVPLYINGEFFESKSNRWLDITNPANGEKLGEVPFTLDAEMEMAVKAAKEAFREWKNTPVPERVRFFFKYQQLLKENQTEIAKVLSQENGKTLEDAMGDVWRGIEVVEHACSAANHLMGETVENVAKKIDTYSVIQPLGVCAGITPFNFPAMIPLWMFPLAIVAGNTFILKPSEQDPLTPTMLTKLFDQAGFPKGVLNLVHGGKDQVDFILENPAVKALSFVGSAKVGAVR